MLQTMKYHYITGVVYHSMQNMFGITSSFEDDYYISTKTGYPLVFKNDRKLKRVHILDTLL